jgi:hypothetical protein
VELVSAFAATVATSWLPWTWRTSSTAVAKGLRLYLESFNK